MCWRRWIFGKLTDHTPCLRVFRFCFVLLLPRLLWPVDAWVVIEKESKHLKENESELSRRTRQPGEGKLSRTQLPCRITRGSVGECTCTCVYTWCECVCVRILRQENLSVVSALMIGGERERRRSFSPHCVHSYYFISFNKVAF